MGFHGYEHNASILGSPIEDCCRKREKGCDSHYSTGKPQEKSGLHLDRPNIPDHRNDGPIDLSKLHTPTGRGTWSIGGVPSFQAQRQLPNRSTSSTAPSSGTSTPRSIEPLPPHTSRPKTPTILPENSVPAEDVPAEPIERIHPPQFGYDNSPSNLSKFSSQ